MKLRTKARNMKVPRVRMVVAAAVVSFVALGCESGGTGDARAAAGTQSTGTTHLMRPDRRYRRAWRNSR